MQEIVKPLDLIIILKDLEHIPSTKYARMKDCHGCIGQIKEHREHYRKVIQMAREIAKNEQRTVTIYRNERGDITLEPTGTIERFITSHM